MISVYAPFVARCATEPAFQVKFLGNCCFSYDILPCNYVIERKNL